MTLADLDQWLDHWGRSCRAHEPLHLRPGEDAPVKLSSLWQQWLCSQWWRDIGEPQPPADDRSPPNEEWVRAIEWAMEGERMQKRHRRWLTKWYVQKRGDVSEECRLAALVALQYLLTEKYL